MATISERPRVGVGVDHAHLEQIAIAADSLGHHGVLIPAGKSCEDAG